MINRLAYAYSARRTSFLLILKHSRGNVNSAEFLKLETFYPAGNASLEHLKLKSLSYEKEVAQGYPVKKIRDIVEKEFKR